MKIKLNLDSVGYKEKPTEYYGYIRNRLKRPDSMKELEPDELIEYVLKGCSFAPGYSTGSNGDTWQSQQLICVDIDNDEKDKSGKKIMVKEPLDADRALLIMEQHGIKPYFMYYTFSDKPEWPRFRIVLVLDQPLTDQKKMTDLTKRLAQMFNTEVENSTDTSISDGARYLLGARPERNERDTPVIWCGGITTAATLEALPEVENENEDNGEPKKPKEYKVNRETYTGPYRTQQELDNMFEADKQAFDLAGYVETTTGSRPKRVGKTLFFNPCPLCGHKNDFQVTGGLYHCHSASGGTGGSIIDYLSNKEGISIADAIEKFKFEIMGYDPEEWKQAFYLEQQAAAREDFKALKDSLIIELPPLPEETENNTETPTEAIEAPESTEAGETKDTEEKPPTEATEADKEGSEEKELKAKGTYSDFLDNFLERIQTEAFRPFRTGLNFFDNMLGGGIMKQTLLLLLAAPASGKTTLCMQIAEQMALNKKPIIYINLEMSREQMLAKAISYRLARRGFWMTQTDILQGYNWNRVEKEEVIKEMADYKKNIAPYLQYNPERATNNLEEIKKYLEATGEVFKDRGLDGPAIVLDYLHLINGKPGQDIKEVIKDAVKVLKDYAIKYNTFVISIIAANRSSNQNGRYSLDSGRDSSNLEYTADYQLSLNHFEVDAGTVKVSEQDKIDELNRREYRRMVIRVLKNRGGGIADSHRVFYRAKYNIFYGDTEFRVLFPDLVQEYDRPLYDINNLELEANTKPKKSKNRL